MKYLLALLLLNVAPLVSDNVYDPIPVYDDIADICHPTLDDYRHIQDYLTYGERNAIEWLKDYQPNARNFKIIGEDNDELPKYEMIAVNCSENDRENCVVAYSSFNKNYPRGLKRLVDYVQKSDFRGHIIYRLGGWPNVEGGSLVLAHVPYAFKVSALKEAERLGFKRAFWMDTAVLPVASLNDIFKMVEAKGFFVMGNSHHIGPYMNFAAADAFGLTLEDCFLIPSCSAGICGFDFTNKTGAKILTDWYHAAQNKVAFFSPRSDQNALSIILFKMGLSHKMCSVKRLAHQRNDINPDTLFLINREFVNELSLTKYP